jgi:putative SOS response-associated peptidase YedK
MISLLCRRRGQQAIRELAGAMRDEVGNMPPFPGIFPDYAAPIVRNQPYGRELTMARWGMPSPVFALQGKKSDPGVTNVRNVKSPHWRRWRGALDERCCRTAPADGLVRLRRGCLEPLPQYANRRGGIDGSGGG